MLTSVSRLRTSPVLGWVTVHWEAARDLADRGYQLTGLLREQKNCTPVRFSR